MIESPKNLTEQLLNLVERLATVLRAQLATINEKLGKEEAQTTYVPRTEVGSLQGPKGDAGPYYSPTVSVDGVLSWTNTGNLANPDPINLKGPKGDKGDTGDTGPQGDRGPQGLQGPKGAQGPQGLRGPQGPAGTNGAQGPKGDTGAVFTPAVDAAGNLSWTNNGGLSNPATVNIKGPKGNTGERGLQGPKGERGPQGPEGERGPQGPQGPVGESGATMFTYGTSDLTAGSSPLETGKLYFVYE